MIKRARLASRPFYSLLILDHVANPIVPSANPATDAPHEKKFRKKVDSKTWITIKKGRIMPNNIRITPRLRRRRGEFIIGTILTERKVEGKPRPKVEVQF